MEKRNTAKHHIASRSMVICWILIFALYAFTLADQYYNDTHNTISKSIAFGIIIFWPAALIITGLVLGNYVALPYRVFHHDIYCAGPCGAYFYG